MKLRNTCQATMKRLISNFEKPLIIIDTVLSIFGLYRLSPITLDIGARSVPEDKAGYSFYQFFRDRQIGVTVRSEVGHPVSLRNSENVVHISDK